jgi:hypothetical protein
MLTRRYRPSLLGGGRAIVFYPSAVAYAPIPDLVTASGDETASKRAMSASFTRQLGHTCSN